MTEAIAHPETTEYRHIPVELKFHHLLPKSTLAVVIRSFGAEWAVIPEGEAGPFSVASSFPKEVSISRVSMDPWSIHLTVSGAEHGSILYMATGLRVAPEIDAVVGDAELTENGIAEIACGGECVQFGTGRWELKV